MKNLKQNYNFLKNLEENVKDLIQSDYYNIDYEIKHEKSSLRKTLENNRFVSIITEVKFSSPSQGKIRNIEEVNNIVHNMEKGGSSGISVLTQPHSFEGSLENLSNTRKTTKLPILMKDIIIDEVQIDAAKKLGADVILLIEKCFKNKSDKLDNLIKYAHNKDIEILLEVDSEDEFERSIKRNADIIGINNRDLETLEIDMNKTLRILEKFGENYDKPIITESGIESINDIKNISKSGIRGCLIGTSIMRSNNIENKVKELSEVEL